MCGVWGKVNPHKIHIQGDKMSESKTPKEKELSPQEIWDYEKEIILWDTEYEDIWNLEDDIELQKGIIISSESEMEDLAMRTVRKQRVLEALKNKLSLKKTAGEDGIDELATQIIEREAKIKEMKEEISEMKEKISKEKEELLHIESAKKGAEMVIMEQMEEEEWLQEETRKLIDSL